MKNKLQLFALPDVKTYYQPTVNKKVCNWYRGRQVHQRNARAQRRTLNTYGHMINYKAETAKLWGKSLFNKEFWVNWLFIWKKIKLDLYFTPIINSRWIVDKTIRLLGKYFHDLREGKDFLKQETKVTKHKEKNITKIRLKSRTFIHQIVPIRKYKCNPQSRKMYLLYI